jgi:hypothetical protein
MSMVIQEHKKMHGLNMTYRDCSLHLSRQHQQRVLLVCERRRRRIGSHAEHRREQTDGQRQLFRIADVGRQDQRQAGEQELAEHVEDFEPEKLWPVRLGKRANSVNK